MWVHPAEAWHSSMAEERPRFFDGLPMRRGSGAEAGRLQRLFGWSARFESVKAADNRGFL